MTRSFLRRMAALALAITLAAGIAVTTPAVASVAATTDPCVCGGGGGGGTTPSSSLLSDLRLDQGTLSPTFTSTQTQYTSAVAHPVASVTVSLTTEDPYAAVSINGSPSRTTAIPLAVGDNPISVVVTGTNGSSQLYTVTVTRAASSNADLSSLSLSAATLSPSFAAGTTSYSATVSHATSAITVDAVPAAGATVTINGGASPAVIPLNTGSNTITVVATAPDGTRKTTTVTVVRIAPSSNSALAALTVAGETLAPTFAAGTTAYSLTVPSDRATVTVGATAASSAASVMIASTSVQHSGSAIVALSSGTNSLPVTVTAENGTTTTYTLSITRLSSSDSRLSEIALSAGALSPTFSASTTSYTAQVGYLADTITIGTSTTDAAASVTVNGAPNGVTVPLSVGANTITIVATSADASATRTTIITVTRAAPDLSLSSLTVSAGTLSPAFSAGTSTYLLALPNSVSSLDIAATASVADWTMTISGATTGSATIAAPVGTRTVTIRVTALHGETRDHTITVTRAPSSDATLGGLTLSTGTLSPAFDPTVRTYSAAVDYTTTQLTVGASAFDATATLVIDGEPATSDQVDLEVGENVITVVATAQDGLTTRTTTVVVTRAAPQLDLATFTVTGGTLSPAFDTDTTSYTVDLPYTVSSLDVAATPVDAATTLKINGVETDAATLAVPIGTSTITVRTTALHGENRDHTVTVTRAAASTDADLADVTLSAGTLSPSFTPGRTSYTTTVDYLTTEITVGAAVADAASTLTIDGAAVASAVVALAVGTTTVTLVTTAQDGVTTQTTTVAITREDAPAPAVGLELDADTGDRAAGAATRVTAAHLLAGSTATLTMHSTPVLLATGTVLADGTIALSARLPLNAESGAHRLVFEGTAMDGSAVTRTAWFTVLRDGTIGGVSLIGPVAYLEPTAAPPTPKGGLQATGTDASPAALLGTLAASLGLLLMGIGVRLRRRTA